PDIGENGSSVGELAITNGDLTIVGMSASVTIDASNLDNRIFQVSPRAHLTLENVIITGGSTAIYEPGGQSGGAIWNDGTLDLNNCVLIGNLAGSAFITVFGQPTFTGGNGGAIYNAGKLSMLRCTVIRNACGIGIYDPSSGTGANGGSGGGIYNSGEMTLDACLISSNLCGPGGNGASVLVGSFPGSEVNPADTQMSPGGNGGEGGGIYNAGRGALSFSTVSDNSSGDGGNGFPGREGGNGGPGGDGAGIFNAGTLNLNTCTISENVCGKGGVGGEGYYNGNGGNGGEGGNGGGVFNIGILDPTSCTIADNIAGMGGQGANGDTPGIPGDGGAGGSGGGIVNDTNGEAIVRNTLIGFNDPGIGGAAGMTTFPGGFTLGNPGVNGSYLDVAGIFVSQGFNLISVGDGSAGFINGVYADQVGSIANAVNPGIGFLQMNGGFTPTCALLRGSPAIDQGKCFGVHRDQRGRYRPYIYSSISKPSGGDGSDIGAFELDTH
ncbi:MAG TPA: choice-of-anchor Q domain-containing protein, partial [Verrucomicrobiae bacterium]